jgi:hypothetical protein
VFAVTAILRIEWALSSDDSSTSVGLRDVLGPFGETVAVSLTSPVKPLMLSTLTMKLEFVPAEIVNDAGTADTPKLGAAEDNTVTDMLRV